MMTPSGRRVSGSFNKAGNGEHFGAAAFQIILRVNADEGDFPVGLQGADIPILFLELIALHSSIDITGGRSNIDGSVHGKKNGAQDVFARISQKFGQRAGKRLLRLILLEIGQQPPAGGRF
ncbi:hypothetical protein SD70_10340 [Gordoniibacillus kamchatkensis]|uniref:Uncharacterized protein n=1 Tax=Gordoniibacillus kamchatkensis TaxID=1590651 RepID=A0ABR5AJ78_9BACL|nr:hypothetical protein SD70_10340 [Paenibacillus sp. VKM B-2647]